MEIAYSVIIRTTGKAGEKYRHLLSSISRLEPQPKEVIVVLPEGYNLPEDRLGWETFCFCPKGMVIQRLHGIQQCKTPYALVTDDDIAFGPDFVQKLHEPVAAGLCGLSAGPLYSFLPQPGAHALLDALMANAAPTVFHRDRYVSVLKSTGYSYNRHLDRSRKKYCETQSLAWTCFYGSIEALRSIDFETEQLWLDKNGYSALDDQTMFYKAWLRGIRTLVVTDAPYEHLDARTSTRNNRLASLYTSGFNQAVFWHRFIYALQPHLIGKMAACIAFGYRIAWTELWNLVCAVRGKMTPEDVRTVRKGRRDAWAYIKSEEYRALAPVRE